MKGIVQRGENTFAIILELGRDAQGRRRQKWITFHGTAREAEKERARLITQLTQSEFVEPSKLTMGSYLSRWLDEYAAQAVAPKTLERYRELVEKHIVPRLGSIRLDKLTPLHIQHFLNECLRSGRRDGKGGLSPRTVLHLYRLLHNALGRAVRWQLLARNPADAVDPPRVVRGTAPEIDPEVVLRVIEATRGTRLHLPTLLAAGTGMRRGEILALHWRDIDWETGTLVVRRSLEQTRKGGLRFKETKTDRIRTIALPDSIIQELRSARKEQARVRLIAGPLWEDNDLVCCRDDGRPWEPNGVSHAFLRIVREAKLPPIRFHDLRHAHASLLAAAGVPMKEISARLGHSGIGITMDLYSHLLAGEDREAAGKIDAILRQVVGRQT